ncbi:MAG: HDIG domain-containing protein [Thermoplasmatales archaeon]|nr:MAG: HDIG domain-containing protein [Thermoplasmatales archaeon]
MIGRQQGLELLKKYLKNENLIKHSLAVEAILKEMAKMLGEDEELWGLVGLLHDLDYDYTKEEPEKHSTITSQILGGLVPKEVINAIKSHNYQHSMQVPETVLDKSLIAADAVSGLVIATALVVPSKKLSDVELKTLINKFKDNSFARGCNRKKIELCVDVGIEHQVFLELSLDSLKSIADTLGL